MANTCGPNKQTITLDDQGDGNGYESEAKCREAGEKAADKKIAEVNACTGRCDQPEGKNLGCIRVGPHAEIVSSVKTVKHKDSDGDEAWWWYLDGTINSRCMCLPA